MVVTVASWIGLTVSAHRDGSPNRSCSRRASAAEYLRRCGSMRIWQRRAIACTRAPERSVTVNWKGSVRVVRVVRGRFEGRAFQHERTLAQAGQELREGGPDLRAAVEPLPA